MLAATAAGVARAQDTSAPAYKISYTISMPEPASHLFHVRVDVNGVKGADYVDFQMPRWSPGRYAVFDFAKNVQEARVSPYCKPQTKCERTSQSAERLDTQTWRADAQGADGLTFSYKVFADDLSGTFSQLDARHANFNGHSVFAYVAGHKHDPVSLKIDAPKGWKIINGQSKGVEQTEFSFANYDLLADTPTEVAPDFNVQTFEFRGKTYRVVVHSFGDEGGRRDELARRVERVVRTEVELMPEPDYEQYTFLFHFDPTARRGDGMEHLNSTQIIETSALGDGRTLDEAVGTAAHEFFHVWNVKRLRPAGLGPWDFTRPVVTRGLWIAEGFTNYYGKLAQRRAGLWDDEQLLRAYAGAIGGIENQPGVRLTSAVETSLLAPFIDRAAHDQKTNVANTLVSYYPKGETVAVALDLLIRGRSGGRASLDDVMRRAYTKFYLESPRDSYYLKGRAYTVEEFERLASETTGLDLSDFFRRYVHRPETLPYEEAFAYVGLRFTRSTTTASNTPRTHYRIEKDDKAAPAALALREAWLKGK
jgi:predicted metalloprotease with PDZ domain